MQKFVIDPRQANQEKIKIHGSDARHILKVLRLKSGDFLSLTDGKGTDYQGTIVQVSPSSLDVRLGKSAPSPAESDLWITLCSGMLKHRKMDWVIENVVPLGISEWIPFFCERSIPRPDVRDLEKKVSRWETLVKESLKQCRRSQLVQVHSPMSFEEMMGLTEGFDEKFAFWEEAIDKPVWASSSVPERVMILIGPEGGFSTEEILLAKSHGFTSCSLGSRILRSEIATMCACTLVQHRFGDM